MKIEIEGLAELRAAVAGMDSALTKSLDDALADSGKIVASRAQALAPVRSGRMRGSVEPFTEGGTVGGVRVTAKRISRSYPGGFAYPARIEKSQPFLRPAIEQKSQEVVDRMTRVLDEVAAKWGGT